MNIQLDDIQALKAKQRRVEMSDEEHEALRKEVQKILKRREEEEKAWRRAEIDRLAIAFFT